MSYKTGLYCKSQKILPKIPIINKHFFFENRDDIIHTKISFIFYFFYDFFVSFDSWSSIPSCIPLCLSRVLPFCSRKQPRSVTLLSTPSYNPSRSSFSRPRCREIPYQQIGCLSVTYLFREMIPCSYDILLSSNYLESDRSICK